jgi:hypothetical protein
MSASHLRTDMPGPTQVGRSDRCRCFPKAAIRRPSGRFGSGGKLSLTIQRVREKPDPPCETDLVMQLPQGRDQARAADKSITSENVKFVGVVHRAARDHCDMDGAVSAAAALSSKRKSAAQSAPRPLRARPIRVWGGVEWSG